jgi:prophage antirepressor-like protein
VISIKGVAMNDIPAIAFQYKNWKVRIEMILGQPWFCLTDVCQVLGIENSRNVKKRIPADKIRDVHSMDTIGRKQETTFISESGLYETILGSRTNERTESFKRWVTDDVLPSIMRTGSYQMPVPRVSNAVAMNAVEYKRQLLLNQLVNSMSLKDTIFLDAKEKTTMIDTLKAAQVVRAVCPELQEETEILYIR